MVRLTVLGCSGSYPGPGQPCSGYLIRGGGVTVALDMGSGSLANLQRHVGADELDAVVLTHSHPDHWVDLACLSTLRKYRYGLEGLPVFGTADNRAKAEGLIGEFEPVFDWHDQDDGDSIRVGGLTFSFSRTDHYVHTLAVRVDGDGATWAYSADTGPAWSFAELGSRFDLQLCEATNLAADEGDGVLHLSARQAGEMAARTGADRLVLTHLLPQGDPGAYVAEGSAAFGRPVELARTDAHFDI